MIKTLSECEAKVLAMAIDTEGTITITYGRSSYRPYIQFSNTDYRLVNFVKRLIDDDEDKHIGDNSNTCKDINKVIYVVSWRKYEEMIDILDQVTLYLICKKEQAVLLREYCLIRQRKTEGFRRASYGEEEYLLYEDITKLNKRGRKITVTNLIGDE